MRAINATKAAALALSVAFAAGCGTNSTNDTDSTGATTGTTGATTAPVTETPVATSQVVVEEVIKPMVDLAALQSVFYFDFDKSVVKAAGFADLEKHAAYLVANTSASVRLEGHADERGTREYNMALGENRANAVARFLQVNGVSASQLEVISYGEEKPELTGHNEASWAENRRVEIKYVTK